MQFSLFRTLSLRHLRLRWSRAVMVIASIALGVATMVATRALNRSMQEAMKSSTHPLEGMAELVVSNGDVGVRLDLAPEVAQVPGVKSVMPLLIENVILPDLDRRGVLIGANIEPNSVQKNPWGITWDITDLMQAFRYRENSVLVGRQLAPELTQKLEKGFETFRIRARGETIDVPRWAGVMDASGPAASLGGNVIYMNVNFAGPLLKREGVVTRLDVSLDPKSDLNHVRAEIERVLAGRAAVRTPQEFDQFNQQSINALQLGFSFCGAGALVVGLFLVYNVLSVSVAERRHEIGILRSLGATRVQVCALFLGEAAILGFMGAILGLPLGIGLANLGLRPVLRVFSELFTEINTPTVALGADTLVVAAASGIMTALLAAWIPAQKASNEQPANAVRRNPPPADLAHLLLQLISGATLIFLGLVCMALRDYLPPRYGNYGCLVGVILGLLLLTPFFSTLIANALRPAVRRAFGIETRLAADNLVRAPGRTGLVITAVAAGVGMVLQTAGVIRSNHDVILGWLDSTILADLIVSSGSPVGGGGQTSQMKETVAGEIASSNPAIDEVLPVRFRQIEFGGNQVYMVALEAAKQYRVAKRALEEGRTPRPTPGLELYPRLAEPGTACVIVSENFAALYHVKTGEHITLAGPDGALDVEVIGTVEDYSWNLGTIIVDRGFYREKFKDSLADVFNVIVKPDANVGTVREDILRRWGVEYALVVFTRQEVRRHIEDVIQRLYNIAYSQEIVMALVAALGVVTALLISVIQRRHEIGVLRALGATRFQVLRSVLAEAALMGLIGTLIGLAVGVPIEWYILQVILFEEAGFRFAVSVPWTEAAVIGVLAMVVATLAGFIPALHTLRLRIPEAIAYE
jgi:putative ABC transport system permease protein